MNKLGLFIIIAGFLLSASCNQPKTGTVKLNNAVDSISYALGYSYANAIKENILHPSRTPFDSVDYKLIALALSKYGLSKEAKEMWTTQFKEINEKVLIMSFNNELCFGNSLFKDMNINIYLNSEYERIRDEIATENLVKGMNFLQENGKRPEVITLESGLQYEVLVEGTGEIPTDEDIVKVHYHGTLIDGKVFDSSVERGEPATFRTTGVIRGWIEALQMMPVGSTWILYIPADMAYGQRGSGREIGPNEVLIFEVQLLEIEDIER